MNQDDASCVICVALTLLGSDCFEGFLERLAVLSHQHLSESSNKHDMVTTDMVTESDRKEKNTPSALR